MTSGNKASVLVTPHYQVGIIQKFESPLQIWKKKRSFLSLNISEMTING